MDALLAGLNPAQREAVAFGGGPLLVLAGAGSGKTRVLTTRITRLIAEEKVVPERILAVTFTNKAAGEMRERIARQLGEEPRGMWMGTFHAIGARILRRDATRLGWTLPRAEKVLDSLEDGYRVCSEVTDDGLIVYEFRELLFAHPEPPTRLASQVTRPSDDPR